jgi:DNA adenine methylase
MTHYPGGKKRIGKEIAEEIYNWSLEYEDISGKKLKGYCEPFCGMLGVYCHIPALFDETHSKMKYLAGDRDPTVICMWKAAQKGWKPPRSCTETKFYRLKKTKDKITPEKAFLGRAAGFRNLYFSTYRNDANIYIQAKNVENIGEELYDVKFSEGNFTQFSNLKNFVIYCDPPYRNTTCKYLRTGQTMSDDFDHFEFYTWLEKMRQNNIIFVSEYNMPKKYKKIWNQDKEKLYLI